MRSTTRRSPIGKPLLGVAIVTGLILLIPAVAMQFTSEVDWGPEDFIVGGLLLFAAGSAMVLGARRFSTVGGRVAFVGAVAFVLVLIWAELAVGLFS